MAFQPTYEPAPLPTRLNLAKRDFARRDFIGPAEVDAFERQVEALLADGTANDPAGFIGFVPAKPRDALRSAMIAKGRGPTNSAPLAVLGAPRDPTLAESK